MVCYFGYSFWMWIVAALFAVPSALSKYVLLELKSLISGRLTYYQLLVIFWILSVLCTSSLCDCVLLHYDSLPSSKKRWSYVWETQTPQMNTPKNTFVFLVSYVPYHAFWTYNTGLFISPFGISELDCATTKTDTAERSISIGRESLQVFFLY